MNLVCLVIGHNYQIQPHPPMPYTKLDVANAKFGVFPDMPSMSDLHFYEKKFSYCDRCGAKEFDD